MTEPEFLSVGRILRPHGVRGDLLLEALTDFPEALPGKTAYLLEGDGPPRPLAVTAARWHRKQLLVHFEGLDDRRQVEDLRGLMVQIETAQAEPPAEGQYYHHQIVGLRVVTQAGEALGLVEAILETGANDVYLVRTPEGSELLLPAIRDVIKQIDLEGGQIVVQLLEGLR